MMKKRLLVQRESERESLVSDQRASSKKEPLNHVSFEEMKISVASIASSVASLTDLVSTLTESQARSIGRTKKLAIIAIVGLFLDIILTGSSAYLYIKSQKNETSISVLRQQVLDAITAAGNIDAQCIFYTSMLGEYDSNSPRARLNREKYDEAFKRLEGEAFALGCPVYERGTSVS